MYMIPICFASVVRSTRARAEPLTGCLTGQGRVTIGFGTTEVMASSGAVDSSGAEIDATPIGPDAQLLFAYRCIPVSTQEAWFSAAARLGRTGTCGGCVALSGALTTVHAGAGGHR
jgi:hypothetical protein